MITHDNYLKAKETIIAKTRNLGVKGEKTLLEFHENAKLKYGHWGDEDLITYRNSHGHCVKSKY